MGWESLLEKTRGGAESLRTIYQSLVKGKYLTQNLRKNAINAVNALELSISDLETLDVPQEYKNNYKLLVQSLTSHMKILKARVAQESGVKEAHFVLALLNTFVDILESVHCLFENVDEASSSSLLLNNH